MTVRLLRATALCAALLALPSVTRSDPAGFAFLEVPAGSRASALGGAYASRAEGVEAAFWNPAGLAGVKGVQITASHYEFLQRLRHAQFAVAEPRWGGGMAVSLRAMYSEPIVERDLIGNEIGTFGSHDLELALAYGRGFGGGMRLGGSAQIVRERIAELAATTYAFGAGATWDPTGWPELRLSASAHNLGPAPSFLIDGQRGADVPLPSAVQAGASYGLTAGGLEVRGSLESRLTRGRSGIGMLGLEAAHASGAALRAGLRLNDDASNVSFGAGYSAQALRLDYAFVPYRLDLGDTHRFSLTLQF